MSRIYCLLQLCWIILPAPPICFCLESTSIFILLLLRRVSFLLFADSYSCCRRTVSFFFSSLSQDVSSHESVLTRVPLLALSSASVPLNINYSLIFFRCRDFRFCLNALDVLLSLLNPFITLLFLQVGYLLGFLYHTFRITMALPKIFLLCYNRSY